MAFCPGKFCPSQGRNHGLKLRGPSAGAPSPENFSIFLSENGEFWCILGGACALYVATAQESDAEEEERERSLVKDDIMH